MNIYIMRHGTTFWNQKGIIQGHSFNRLSVLGQQEVEDAAKKYAKIQFDIIITSPLTRTVQTANIMNKYHTVKILKDKRIIEVDKGIFTKRLKSSLSAKEKEQRKNRDQSCGIESYEDVYLRCSSFLTELINKSYNNLLIITHATVATMLENIILNKQINLKKIKDLDSFKNAEIRKYNLIQQKC